MGYSSWGSKESDMTEQLTHTHTHIHPGSSPWPPLGHHPPHIWSLAPFSLLLLQPWSTTTPTCPL